MGVPSDTYWTVMALLRPLVLAALLAAGCGREPPLPDVRGMPLDEAQHLLASRDLRWSVDGADPQSRPGPRSGLFVLRQNPAPAVRAEEGSVVELRTARPTGSATPLPARPFDAVRPTRNPRAVRIVVRAPRCLRLRAASTHLAGEVALVGVDARVSDPRVCDVQARHAFRARFPRPLSDEAVLPHPVLRPRATDGARTAAWEHAAAASPDGRTIAVAWTTGIPACNSLAGLDADERPDEVRIRLRTGRPAGSDPQQACILLGVPAVATVRLREPLGSRRRVDASR